MAGINPAAIPFDDLVAAQEPVVMTGLAAQWPLVRAGLRSAREAADILARHASARPVTVYSQPPGAAAPFHYDASGTALNFAAARAPLAEVLDRLIEAIDDPEPPVLYVGSTDLDQFLPGLSADNALTLDHPQFAHGALASIWIGNRTTVPAHYDVSNNLACCVCGHRRFTIYPPDQIGNLYPGPLEPTPAGQVVSMVDMRVPDLARHPGFAEARATAVVADLEPGDVLFYPALWWHQVEALDPFNILVNYWWNPVAAFHDTPETTLLHAILSLRDRPDSEKAAWKAVFDYYVFGPADRASAHLPEAARGALGPLDEMAARRLRAKILNRINR